MRNVVWLLLSLVALPLAAQQPANSPELPTVSLPPELDRVLREYEREWGARNAAGLAALFAEDGFVMQGSRPPARGRAAIIHAYTGAGGPLFLRALAYSTEGNTGWIIGGYKGQSSGTDDGKFVLALKKGIDGRWLIAADIDNSNRPPRRPPGP
ncbi:MAG TPA: nuclear transport factor 2 family protein [Gemmatimonadales bacterium]